MATKATARKKRKRQLKPGQPSAHSSLNNEVEKRLCEYLQAGIPLSLACDAIGLPRRTFYHWEEVALQSDDPENRYQIFRRGSARRKRKDLSGSTWKSESWIQNGYWAGARENTIRPNR
jgi:hypothetical protein